MTIPLPHELRQALAAHPEEPVRLVDPQTKESYVVLRAEVYDRLRTLLEGEEDEARQKAWLEMATQARRAWVRGNPY